MKSIIITTFFVLTCFTLHAQERINLVNSGELIDDGIEYFDQEKYDKALLKFQQIPENDTNYNMAIYEIGLTYINLKEYDKAIMSFEKALTKKTPYRAIIFQQIGNAYSLSGQLEKALEAYRRGLQHYPNYYRYYAEMASACSRNNKPKQAFLYLDTCLQINFLFDRAHYLMGQLCEANNYFIPAILSYQMAAFVSESPDIKIQALFHIQEIAKGEVVIDKDSIFKIFDQDENNFEEIDEIIRSKSELDPRYKVKPAVKLPFVELVNCLHLVNNRIQMNPEGKGWYYDHIVPIVVRFWKANEFPLVLYRMTSTVENEESKKTYKKYESAINKSYASFYNELLVKRHTYMSKNQTDNEVCKHLYLYNNGNLFCTIPTDEFYDYNVGFKSKNGHYTYYYNNGEIKSRGSFSDGSKTGKWEYFDEKAQLNSITEFESSDEFKVTKYYSNGQIKSVEYFKDGDYDKVLQNYYPNGVLATEIPIENKKIEGLIKYYHDNGQFKKSIKYEDSKQIDGELLEYHWNGVLYLKSNLKNNLLHGETYYYYLTGELNIKMNYVNGNGHGPVAEYYKSGKVKETYNFDNGYLDGTHTTYYENGNMDTEKNYKKGDQVGVTKHFDIDGKIYAEYNESKGKLKNVTFYDKAGKIIYSLESSGSEKWLEQYNPMGIKIQEGKVKKDYRVGEWKFYNWSGALTHTKTFDNSGKFNGKVETFVAGEILDSKYEEKDNLKHGYFIDYYVNGNKYEEGNYVEGEPEGVWKVYYANKNPASERYYLEGTKVGSYFSYYPNGKLRYIEDFEEGLMSKYTYYDIKHSWVSTDTIGFPYGNLTNKTSDGKPIIHFNYRNGKREGKQILYWLHGKIRSEEFFINDVKHGDQKYYDNNGILRTINHYKFGRLDSISTYLYEDGSLRGKTFFRDGEEHGEDLNYHENGKLMSTGTYYQGSKHGWFKYYSPEGSLQYSLYHHWGTPIAYSGFDKNGQKMDSVLIKNGTADITFYYPNRQVSVQISLVNGERNGQYIKYYPNGKKEFEVIYKYGHENGPLIEYYENGNTQIYTNYENNYKSGKQTEYYPNGKLKKESNYEYGFLQGPVKIYKNGVLSETINYLYDERVD